MRLALTYSFWITEGMISILLLQRLWPYIAMRVKYSKKKINHSLIDNGNHHNIYFNDPITVSNHELILTENENGKYNVYLLTPRFWLKKILEFKNWKNSLRVNHYISSPKEREK